MKKRLLITVLFIFIAFFAGCAKAKYVVGANSKIEENNSFNHYDFSSFRGSYTFTKDFSEKTTIRLVTFSEENKDLKIVIKQDDVVIYEYLVNANTNSTKYFVLDKGTYDFYLEAEEIVKAEILFNWDGDFNNE